MQNPFTQPSDMWYRGCMANKRKSAAGRPRLQRGAWGNVSVVPLQQNEKGRWIAAPAGTVKAKRWRARAKVRDLDGKIRDVERNAATKSKAERALEDALRNRVTPAQGTAFTVNSTVAEAGRFWLEQIVRPEAGLASRTVDLYKGNFERYLLPSTIANLTLAEANAVPEIRTYLQGVADAHGAGAAKSARSVLSNIFNLAVNDGVLPVNAARGIKSPRPIAPIVRPHGERRSQRLAEQGIPVTEQARDTARAFTREERDAIVAYAYADEASINADMPDVIAFLAGTGVRSGEALAVAWSDVDLRTGRTRIKGTKSSSADRAIVLPQWLLERMRERSERGRDASGLVFPAPVAGGQRDARNVRRHVRRILDEMGYPWATAHTFRRTVASLIDSQGGGVELAANQLGHADASMTARVYLNRRRDTEAAAAIL